MKLSKGEQEETRAEERTHTHTQHTITHTHAHRNRKDESFKLFLVGFVSFATGKRKGTHARKAGAHAASPRHKNKKTKKKEGRKDLNRTEKR